ncbi:MAG: OmpA family protein [Selenomonadaceae bacterium]|nr:OmpA family protein [Selenomonadaceae bacterium]
MRKRNPWVSIADLLSSVVLVLLLLFVMATIVPKYTEEAQRAKMMDQIEEALKEYEESGQLLINKETGVLEFTDLTFSSGSALVNPETVKILQELSGKLIFYMEENPRMEILVEGHTDPAVVSSVQNEGGYFSNNIQLSTLRAANVREYLLKYIGKDYSARVGVAGYGETRLKNKENPLSAENRRIEVRILWNGKNED